MQICKFSQDVRIEASDRTRYCRFTSMPRSAHGFFLRWHAIFAMDARSLNLELESPKCKPVSGLGFRV